MCSNDSQWKAARQPSVLTPSKLMDWTKVAAEYSRLDDSRRAIVFPFLSRIIGELEPSVLLDYGAGDGQFLSQITEQLSTVVHAVSYEPAVGMYDIAKTATNDPKIQVIQSLAEIDSGSVDIVTCIAVWMCLETEEQSQEMLGHIRNVLRVGGHFIAAVTHPCFRTTQFSTYATDFSQNNYLNSGIKFNVRLTDGLNNLTLQDTHWNLSDLSRQLSGRDFQIQRLYELPDVPDRGVPSWLVIHAVMVSRE